MEMPILETERLLIRPFTLEDLDAIHRILDIELADPEIPGTDGGVSREERRAWLEWSVMNYEQLAQLYQPPFGDRAVALKEGGELVGACGYAPCLNAFGQLPAFASDPDDPEPALNTTEVGLYYAFSPRHQRKGYATEAAQALVDYAFQHLHLQRIVATTTYDNPSSIAVMRRLGMRIQRNPYSNPPWLQIVGILENPHHTGS